MAIRLLVLEPTRGPAEPPRVLVGRPGSYLLSVDDEQVDLGQFKRLASAGRRARAAGDAREAARALRAALALWRGPALADVGGSFVDGERSRLEKLRLQAVEDRLAADLDLGGASELVPELEALVAEHPLREQLCGQLMLALYRTGRQAEASAAFHRLRQVLDDELAMAPGPELQQLFEHILTQDPAIEAALTLPPPSQVERSNLPLQLTSFVGRTSEI